MKTQELIVSCCYTHDGTSLQDIVQSSFLVFLKRELEKAASVAHGHV